MFFAKFFEPKPFNQGYLPEVDGHKVFFMEFGNPKGEVVLTTHGGPGECVRHKYEKRFDLKKYRVIVFDQRGVGDSRPFGEVKNNTPWKTVEDMKRLLDYLKVRGKILVCGGSWASTVALLFAIDSPERVSKLLLSQIFVPGPNYRKWEFDVMYNMYPDIIDELRSRVKVKADVPEYYAKLINSDNAEDQYDAIKYYGAYEYMMGALDPKFRDVEVDDAKLAKLRVYMTYDANNYYLEDDSIWGNLDRIKHIPTIIVHNRLDLNCPFLYAWKLHKGIPKSKLVIVPEAGHGGPLMSKVRKEEFARFLDE